MNKSRASSISATSQIAFAQPPLIQEVDIDRVEVKRRRCALEDLIKYKELAERGDATKYWTSVFALKLPGVDAKYPWIAVVVKCCLSLGHGNADTERSFLETAKIFTKHRNCLDP